MGNDTAAAAPAETENTITLRRPIEAHGNTHKVLTLREPDGEDVIECGYPMQFMEQAGRTIVKIDTKVAAAYVARLAGVPPSSLKRMHAQDLAACINTVLAFFGDEVKAG